MLSKCIEEDISKLMRQNDKISFKELPLEEDEESVLRLTRRSRSEPSLSRDLTKVSGKRIKNKINQESRVRLIRYELYR